MGTITTDFKPVKLFEPKIVTDFKPVSLAKDQPEPYGATGTWEEDKGLFAPQESDTFVEGATKGIANELVGIPEVATTLVSGAISAPISYAGEVLTTALAGGNKGEEVGKAISNALTYKPKTNYARETLKNIGKVSTPFTWPGKAGGYVGKKLDEAMGNKEREWEVGLKNVANAPLQAIGLKVGLQQMGLLKKYPSVSAVKSVDAQIDQQISKVIKDKFYHSVRPTGKKKYSELKEFHSRTGNAERWLAENKDHLVYEDIFTGEVTKGHLPKTAIQNAQAFDQGLKILWQRADDLIKNENGYGIIIDKRMIYNKLAQQAKTSTTRTGSGVRNELLKRMGELKADMSENGNFMTLSDVIDDLSKINERTGGKLTAQLSDYSFMKADYTQAQIMRELLYSKIEGIKDLRSLMTDFKTAEPFITKAAARRMNVDPEKMDFLDIGAITAGAHGISQVVTGGGAKSALTSSAIAGTIGALNRMRKHGKDIDIQTDKMYSAIDKIVEPSREIGRVFSRGGTGLPKQPPRGLLEHDTSIPPIVEGEVNLKYGKNVPPMSKPTTRALPMREDVKYVYSDTGKVGKKPFEIIEMNMDDISGQKGSFTVMDSRGRTVKVPIEEIRASFNNPKFWDKNKDLVDLMLRLKKGQSVLPGEMNELLYRVMLKNPRYKELTGKRYVSPKQTETIGKEVKSPGGTPLKSIQTEPSFSHLLREKYRRLRHE